MTAPVLFLDFDGVLHWDGVYRSPTRGIYLDDPDRTLFEYLPHLVQALEPFPQVRIVMSTSWVPELSYSRAKNYLRYYAGRAFASRVIGSTYHSVYTPHWREQTRYGQIRADVTRRLLRDNWLALDNDSAGWPPHARWHLVDTQDCGLRPLDVERLVARLTALAERGGPPR